MPESDVTSHTRPYHGAVLREWIGQRGREIPLGYSWVFAISTGVATLVALIVATAQRPAEDLGMCLLATALAFAADVTFMFVGFKYHPVLKWFTSMVACGILLFATSTPIAWDFAPLLLVLMVSAAVSMSTLPVGVAAAAAAAILLAVAAREQRLEGLALYLPVLGMGWLVGFLLQAQRGLMVQQAQSQVKLAELSAINERRRIAREVHDVIAHSLSITLLHVTGARRGLQEDGGEPEAIAEAIEALGDAERLGRHAMNDIRRTVGLLDAGPVRADPEPGGLDVAGPRPRGTPPLAEPGGFDVAGPRPRGTPPLAEPGVNDIGALVDDFRRAGLRVDWRCSGATDTVSAAVGLALYRITQESLANIAKHAPASNSVVRLDISGDSTSLTVSNGMPPTVSAFDAPIPNGIAGRGLPGMRQRVEQLGGDIVAGRSGHDDKLWQVCVSIPLQDK